MQIIRSNRKTIALIVTLEGELVVRAPRRATRRQIDDLVQSKESWIQKKQELARQQAVKTRRLVFREGETLPYLGKLYPLEVVDSGHAPLEWKEDRFKIHRAVLPYARSAFTRWYRHQARRQLGERVGALSAEHGFTPGKIRIGAARSRWGSCSSRGTLSFPWRLVMCPPEIIDYVIIHELCHLREHNHSPRFWAEVEAIVPDYKAQLKWLKENGVGMSAISDQLEGDSR